MHALARQGGIALALLACAALCAACGGNETVSSGPAGIAAASSAGPPFPSLTLRELGGAGRQVADYLGQPLIVNFWATWCEPCKREMPSLVALRERFGDSGLRVLAVSIDEDAAVVRDYLARNDLPFEIFWDPRKEAFQQCGATLTPTAFIVDRQGHVAERIVGEIDWTDPSVIATVKQVVGKV